MPPEGEGIAAFRPGDVQLFGPGSTGGEGTRRRASADRPAEALVVPPAGSARRPQGFGDRAGWVRNPIDAFLAAEHQQARPDSEPPRRTRRADPPRLPRPDRPAAAARGGPRVRRRPVRPAYEALVDRLLASPQYGERWGRHWMDVWRYSDWDGFGAEVRESQPHIWRWRDWIVESLNADKGYDQMIVADAGRRRGRARRPRRPSAPPASWSATGTSSTATSGSTPPSSTRPRRSWADAQLRQVPRPQVRPDRPDRLLPLPGLLRAARHPHRPRARPGRRRKDGLVRVYDADLDARRRSCSRAATRRGRSRTVRSTAGVPPSWSVRQARRRSRRSPCTRGGLLPGAAADPGGEARPCARPNVEARKGDRSQAERSPRRGQGPCRAEQGPPRAGAGAKGVLSGPQPRCVAIEARIAADRARYSHRPRADADGAGPRRGQGRAVSRRCTQAEEALARAPSWLWPTAEQAVAGSKTGRSTRPQARPRPTRGPSATRPGPS